MGLNLLEAIVKDRMIKNTKLKIQNFKQKSEELIIDKPIDNIVNSAAAGGYKY